MNHEAITAQLTENGRYPYGTGNPNNPFKSQQKEWERRKAYAKERRQITDKIESIFEPRFVTPPETSELIEAVVTASDSRRILEIGTCTGFTSLHILRAIYGKKDAKLTSIDARPAHDRAFWAIPEFKDYLEFVEGWTPQSIEVLIGRMFDLVFVDSDHSVEHTVKELGALWPITKKGTIFIFHDLPEWQSPSHRASPPVRDYIFGKVKDGTFQGGIVPTCEQLDCLEMWGEGYPTQCNPHLGIFVRL